LIRITHPLEFQDDPEARAATAPGRKRNWLDILFKLIVVLALLFLCFQSAKGAEEQPGKKRAAAMSSIQPAGAPDEKDSKTDAPKPISVEDRESVKTLQITAYQAVSRLKDARIQKLEAEKALATAEQDLKDANRLIDETTEALLKRYGAGADWKLDADFHWVPNDKKKP
jgi:hypothetical protein